MTFVSRRAYLKQAGVLVAGLVMPQIVGTRRALATRSVAHWDDLVAHGSFTWHADPARFTATVLSAEQYVVFMGLVESYFDPGYEYYAPESLKPEDQARLADRFDR